MKKSNILAHRGNWSTAADQNSYLSILSAIEAGYGIEIDLRDCDGEIVVSHDPPRSKNNLNLRKLMSELKKKNRKQRIALNIKSDGLANLLINEINYNSIKIDNVFVFDMSFPDMLSYARLEFPYYNRLSEFEPQNNIIPGVRGYWVDNFSMNTSQVEMARQIVNQGLRAAVVSPELHGRDKEETWEEIKDSGLHKSSLFEICTDYPDQAYLYFNGRAK